MPRTGERPVQFDCAKGRQCTAKSKRSGERCRNYACQDRETCRMHGGTSRQGCEHPNFKTGKHSKVMRKAMKSLGELYRRPVQVRIALYPEGLEETIAKPRPERYYVSVSFPDNCGLPLAEEERVLRAIRRQVSSRLREVRDKLDSNASEEE